MSNELPYLPFFVGDFLVTVGTWPAARVGAYVLALFYQFEHGGLPADDETELALILHVSRPVARRLWSDIQRKGKFHKRADGLWWNQRLEDVRSEARSRVALASNRGKAGAAGRWGKGANGHSVSNAQVLPKQRLDDGNQSKDKERTPQPPFQGGRRGRKSKSLASAAEMEQLDKTREVKRLIGTGLTLVEASRQVYGE